MISMKMKKSLFIIILVLTVFFTAACGAMGPGGGYYGGNGQYYYGSGNSYLNITENQFIETETQNQSVVSLSANTAAYTDLKRQINAGYTISPDAVKIEEMLNYFNYDYQEPNADGGDAFGLQSAVIDTPYNADTKLALVGVNTQKVERGSKTNNIVFLLDVSYSMHGDDRLGLIVNGFLMLADELTENDLVSIITYAGSQRIVLDGVSGDKKEVIKDALTNLKAAGSTAGGAAIEMAYNIAAKHKDSDYAPDNSVIIMATDGDFNVGLTDDSKLAELVKEKKELGIGLHVIGVGIGNFKSSTIESITKYGGGQFDYVANVYDAQKVFVETLNGKLTPLAKDAKAMIEFDKSAVKSFRLIGYENRQLSVEDFENTDTTAGTIGSGHKVTAVYEIVLNKNYQSGSLAEFKINYKNPKTSDDKKQSLQITDYHINPKVFGEGQIKKEDSAFIAAVVEFGLLLRNSEFCGTASYSGILNRISNLESVTEDVDKSEFLKLVDKVKRMYDYE